MLDCVSMSITIDRLFDDPSLYFHSFDGDHARFVEMDREHYARSIFFDRRIVCSTDKVYRVPLDLLLEVLTDRAPPPPRLNFIHHVAHCGSTLLARALDRGSASLVIREPFHLRQMAVRIRPSVNASSRPDLQRLLLSLSLTMLGKRYVAGTPVVVKGNVPVSMIGEAIDAADPGRAGILLHFPLEDYLAAVLRSPDHSRWVNSVTGELRLGRDYAVDNLEDLSTPQRAAALWLSLVSHYAHILGVNPAMRSLDANQFFDQPAATIGASAELFSIPMTTEDAVAIAGGPLFKTYAKNPEYSYDAAQRVERREEARRDLSQAFTEARSWLESRRDFSPMPIALERPLLGDPVPLL